MSTEPSIRILSGGVGPERDVALVTGKSMHEALADRYRVTLEVLDDATLPEDLDPGLEIVFPALHGEYGEDGRIQADLEARSIQFCGSGSAASKLCIHKTNTKRIVSAAGVRVVPGISFYGEDPPGAERILEDLGEDLVVKPEDMGSSVNLYLCESAAELESVLKALVPGPWLVERRIRGREISVGILNGRSLGLVELQPQKGVYDYESKYTPGRTNYLFPAEVDPELEAEIRRAAETAFTSCGCRDFARVDFMISEKGESSFMEINTLPGLTPTSLLPKSASCNRISFPELARELVLPALNRLKKAGHPQKN